MEEHKFRKLLGKYLDGSISREEKELLEKFSETLMSQGYEPFLSDEHKAGIKDSLLAGIDSKIGVNQKSRQFWNWRIAASISLFIGLFGIAYFFLGNQKSNSSVGPPEDVITLQLEDGSVKIIEEHRTSEVVDKAGNVVGQQKGNQLVYGEDDFASELVYNTLTVPHGKTFELRLSDGTTAFLNAGSSMKYPVNFLKGKEREVFLVGEAYLNVAKDTLHPFIVRADELNIKVLGTEFNVSAYPEDDISDVVLVEGSVSLFTKTDDNNIGKNTLLEPGHKGSFDKGKNNITKKAVITSIYTSWMNGELVFRDMSFENILKKLERHYDVVISNHNTELSQKHFNANFGNEPLGNVLEELRTNYGIEYEVNGDNITIK